MKTFIIALLTVSIWTGSVWAKDRVVAGSASDSLGAGYYNPEEEHYFAALTARLEDYLAYAARRNPALKASFYNWRALLEKSGYAGALPNPTFSYTYFVENVETRVGPQEQRFGLAQAFPWFGTLGARKDVAVEAANAAYQQYESEKLKLFYRVKSSYYEYYFLGREMAITRDNLQLLKFWESVVRAKYEAALQPHHELIKVQVELAKLEDRLLTVEDMMGPAAARLRAALNAPEDVRLPAPTEIEVTEVSIDRDGVLARVLAHNPDLKSLIHLIHKNKAGRRLAGKMSMPSFSIGVDYVQTGAAAIPDLADNGKDPWMVKLGISLPIWFGANKARKEESEALYRKAVNHHSEVQNQLRVLADKIVFEHEDALRKTRLYRDGLIPKAKQSLNASYAAYQSGEVDFLDLLDAQRQLLDFELQLERSVSNLAISRAAIEMITGQESLD